MTDLLKRAPRRGVPSSLSTALARSPAVAPLVVGLLGLAISLLFITTPSIWYDEAATISATTRTLPELWLMLQNVDAVHGLYYFGLHVVFDAVGYSPLSLRAPSALATGLAAALTVVLARQFMSSGRATIAGVAFCLLPRVTWMGTEGRSYALTAALAVLLALVFIRALRSRGARWWILYGVLAFVSCVLFLYLALVLVAQAVTVLWCLLSARGGARADASPPDMRQAPDIRRAPDIRFTPASQPSHASRLGPAIRFAIVGVVTAAALVPFALSVIAQSGQLHWIDPIDDDTLREVLQTQWFHISPEFAVAGWALIVFGTVALLQRSRLRSAPLPTGAAGPSLASLLLPAVVLPTAVLLVATAAYTPLYTPRYLSMCLPFVAILIGVAINALPSRLIATLTIASLVVLAIPAITAQRQTDAKENTDWNLVAELIVRERQSDGASSDTAIIYGWVRHHPTATSRVIAYSYPDAFEGTTDVTLATPAAETGQLWETRHPLADSLDRLDDAEVTYLITSTKRDLVPDTTVTLAGIGWLPTENWRIADVQVVRYVRG